MIENAWNPSVISPSSSFTDQSMIIFLCEKEMTIPNMTYNIEDTKVLLTMQCNVHDPHVETISYDQYKHSKAYSIIRAANRNKCEQHNQNSVGYCQPHQKHLCSFCLASHADEFPSEVIIPEKPFNVNLNYYCKKHKNLALILYCQQCKTQICIECATDQHKDHTTINMEKWVNELNTEQIKHRINWYKEKYFHTIQDAYIKAQEEWKEVYNKNIIVNEQFFDIIINSVGMWETFKQSYDFNMYNNVINIINNWNMSNWFEYQTSHFTELYNYLKTNHVLNISHIKSNETNSPNNSSINHHISNQNESSCTSIPNPPESQRCEDVVKFKCVWTTNYENVIESLCKWNDTLYAVGTDEPNLIHIVEHSSGKTIRSLTGHSGFIWRLYLHKKTNYLISLSSEKDFRVWNYSNGDCIKVCQGHNDSVNDIAEWMTGDIVTVSDDKSFKFWNVETFTCYKTISNAHTERINNILVWSDSRWVTGGNSDKLWKIWKSNPNNKDDFAHCVNTRSNIWSWLESNDNRWLVGLESGDIWIYDIQRFNQVGMLRQHLSRVSVMLLWSNGYLISGGWDNNLIICDLSTLSCIQKLEGHQNWIYNGWIEMRRNEIISGSEDKTIKKWLKE